MSMFGSSQTPTTPVYAQARQRAASLMNAGQRDAAVPLLRDLLKQQPRDVMVLRMLGNALSQNTQLAAKGTEPEGLRLLKFADSLAPNNPDLLCDIASQCKTLGKTREAHVALDKALKIAPTHGRGVMIKASLLQSGNKVDDALELIRNAMKESSAPSLAISYGQLCIHKKNYQDGIDTLRPLIERIEMESLRRQEVFFILGQLYDKVGEYDRAFECFKTANTMQGKLPASEFDTHLNKWTREAIERIPHAKQDGSRSVLVVGMPRSGTTLTEMILAAHPKVAGIGESTKLNVMGNRHSVEEMTSQKVVDGLSNEYLGMLNELVPDRAIQRVVDKMPENYIYLALASRILPGCRVIHCKRDARDVCLSIYFQAFGPWVKYARDLETVAQQYLGYLRTMEHWRNTLDIQIHDSVYEDLTADPEPNIRAMIEHAGLAFDKACLEPHKTKSNVHTASIAQVRSPIYRSSNQRWKNYEKHIGPMLDLLAGV
jgi:tetratricopeptide (TPR) repeat protein